MTAWTSGPKYNVSNGTPAKVYPEIAEAIESCSRGNKVKRHIGHSKRRIRITGIHASPSETGDRVTTPQ